MARQARGAKRRAKLAEEGGRNLAGSRQAGEWGHRHEAQATRGGSLALRAHSAAVYSRPLIRPLFPDLLCVFLALSVARLVVRSWRPWQVRALARGIISRHTLCLARGNTLSHDIFVGWVPAF